MLPRPASYLVADHVDAYKWLTQWTQGIPARQEHQMFLGFVPLALALWAILGFGDAAARQSRWLMGICLVSLILLVAGTLMVGDKSVYRLLMSLPGISSIRAVSRIILIIAVPVSILAAVGVERLRTSRVPGAVALILLVLAFSFETLAIRTIAAPISEWRSRIATLDAAVASAPLAKDAVIYLTGRSEESDYLPELDAMIFAQDRGLATINGYSGNFPPGYLPPSPCNSPAARIGSMAGAIFRGSDLTPDTLLARTRWIELEPCRHHTALGLASAPPDEKQARAIHLEASATWLDRDSLEAVVRIRNEGDATLHSLSAVGAPLRLSWRFVRLPETAAAASGWDARQELGISLPSDEEEQVRVQMRPPSAPGNYDLQFTLVAEGHAWLHELGMPIAHTPVEIK